MTPKSRKRFALDIVVRPATFLFERGQLGEIQRVLREFAPTWSREARLWRSRSEQRPVNLAKASALEEAIQESTSKRAPLAQALEEQLGPSSYDRFLGSVELRGPDDSLTVIVRADEYVLAPSAGWWLFANEVCLQVRRGTVEQTAAAAWSAQVCEALCAALSPLHADVHAWDEYDAKNLDHEGGGTEAVGVDVSRHLPGIYWLNFFGKPYCELIGRDRLLSAPASEVRALDDGVLLRLADDPLEWASPAYKAVERRVLDYIGPAYFFSKDEPGRRTIAPTFDLGVHRSAPCFRVRNK